MEYGVGIDCVSAGEISVALKAGFDPKKIYFHGNNKLPSEIQYALENGVENFVIDNFYEIELVEEIASKLNVMVNGLVRITPGVYAGGHDYIRVGAKDTKFGFSSHDNTYLKAIKKVIDAPNINFDGIHCHVGSQIEDIQAYVLAMNKFVEIAYEIYDIRKSLDTLATIKAMELMTPEDFDELEALLLEGEQYNKNNQVDDLLQNFSDFNSFIYTKSQMLRLKKIVTDLHAYLIYFRDIAIRASERRSIALEEHWLIFRGMKTKNIDQITLLTHEHLNRSLQFILKEMERRQIE